uniref:C3H1-type domain-containing protein n=1 Tax=Echinostoma caproni TaxID=27848 RepID=A0A183AR03_9TREM
LCIPTQLPASPHLNQNYPEPTFCPSVGSAVGSNPLLTHTVYGCHHMENFTPYCPGRIPFTPTNATVPTTTTTSTTTTAIPSLSCSPMIYFVPIYHGGVQPIGDWFSNPPSQTHLRCPSPVAPSALPVPITYQPYMANYNPSDLNVVQMSNEHFTVHASNVGQMNGTMESLRSLQTISVASGNTGSNSVRGKATTTTASSNTSRPGRKKRLVFHNNILYKTQLCRQFLTSKSCPRGLACQFAHGEHELRDPRSHPLYKTTICQEFWSTGHCNRGISCLHIHPFEPLVQRQPNVSTARLTRPSLRAGLLPIGER